MYLLPYLPAVVGTPRGISKDTRRYAKGHSSAPFYERLAHRVAHVTESSESPRFQMPLSCLCPVPRFITPRCVLSESRVLFCVGLASEANIRKNSLTIQNRMSAQSRRPTIGPAFAAPVVAGWTGGRIVNLGLRVGVLFPVMCVCFLREGQA